MTKNSAKGAQSLKIPKIILVTGKILQFISPMIAARYAARLFTTPLKHSLPKREQEMDRKSRQERIRIDSIGKDVVVYHYGDESPKILLVHGWSGRGTQLVKFADELLKSGYSVISFDAPAHGKSSGKTSIMPEFIATIFQLEKAFGPFEAAVGHSLGGMSLLNSVKRGLQLKRFVTIGSGDIIQDIIDEFIQKLELRPKIGTLMCEQFEKKSHEAMSNYSSYLAAKEIDIPVLVIHDENDAEVPLSCGKHIHDNLRNGELMITHGLGHRKILGNREVIERSLSFIRGMKTVK
jgi:pimeloyl-ACP methyl ester carboxylesterase